MIGTLILFGVLAIIFALGMIADADAQNRKNYTVAFCTLIVGIAVLILKFF